MDRGATSHPPSSLVIFLSRHPVMLAYPGLLYVIPSLVWFLHRMFMDELDKLIFRLEPFTSKTKMGKLIMQIEFLRDNPDHSKFLRIADL